MTPGAGDSCCRRRGLKVCFPGDGSPVRRVCCGTSGQRGPALPPLHLRKHRET